MTAMWLAIYQAFAFPVGTAMGVALVAILYVVETEWGKRRWVKALRSTNMACWTIGLIAVACVIGGLLPADTSFQTSIPFVVLLVALMVNLTLIVFHRLHTFKMRRDWTFMAIHVGLWLALFSGLVGAGDSKRLNVIVSSDEETNKAYDENYRTASLPYSLRLSEFNIETNAADGSPTQYSAKVLVDGEPVEIAVNSPHSLSLSEDMYLMNFNSTRENGEVNVCMLTIERQPWKYPMLAGLSLLLFGAVARLKN